MTLTTMLAMMVLADGQKPFNFLTHGPYDSGIKSPRAVLGYDPGDKHTVYHDQERFIQSVAKDASDRAKVFYFGKSVEGRPLRVVAISTPENIAKLEQYRKQMEELSNPDPSKDYTSQIKNMPAFVWINETIHGDETASFESGMWLIYNLTASRNKRITDMLKNTIVLVNPAYNPDGHERYVVWYNSIATGRPEDFSFEHNTVQIMAGRANHYRFDMNRDRVSLSQDESRQEVKEFQRWNPQVYVDQHGQVRGYFFPPNALSQNVNADRDRMNRWNEVFGRATAKNFDQHGWNYYIKEVFDLYYVGYLDAWTSLNGAIGMTHETDGGRTESKHRDDETVLTLREGAGKHMVSALTVIESSSEKKDELLQSFVKFKKAAVTGSHAGSFKRVVVTSKDSRVLGRMANLLSMHGLKYSFTGSALKHDDANNYWTKKKETVEFPAGSLVIDTAQPRGQLAKALLEPESNFEPEFIKEQMRRRELDKNEDRDPDAGNYEFYDLTGWSLIYGFDVEAWWCESAPAFEAGNLLESKQVGLLNPDKAIVGWQLPYSDEEDMLAAIAVMQSGVRVQVATKDLDVAGGMIKKGSFIIFRGRNDEGFEKKLEAVAKRYKIAFHPIQSGYPESGRDGTGSASVVPLRKPKIGIVFGNGTSPTMFGSVWYLFERVFKLDFVPLTSNALNGDLNEFTSIIVPQGNVSIGSKLKDWANAGGSLVILGNTQAAIGESAFVKLDRSKMDKDKNPPMLPGTLFESMLDMKSPLSYGYSANKDGKVSIAIPVDGSTYYKAKSKGEGTLLIASDAKDVNALSGWVWPEDTAKALAGTVWCHEVRSGRGQVTIFMNDPTERILWPGMNKMILNAIVFGAG